MPLVTSSPAARRIRVFVDTLVDHPPHPLGTGIRGDGGGFDAAAAQRGHQVVIERIGRSELNDTRISSESA